MGSIDWGVMWYAAPYMARGAVVTLEICSLAMIAGCIIGVIGGLLSLSEIMILKVITRSYVYFVRGTPALLLYRDVLNRRDRLALACFCSTQLPLVLAITTLAQSTGHMRASTAASLVPK